MLLDINLDSLTSNESTQLPDTRSDAEADAVSPLLHPLHPNPP